MVPHCLLEKPRHLRLAGWAFGTLVSYLCHLSPYPIQPCQSTCHSSHRPSHLLPLWAFAYTVPSAWKKLLPPHPLRGLNVTFSVKLSLIHHGSYLFCPLHFTCSRDSYSRSRLPFTIILWWYLLFSPFWTKTAFYLLLHSQSLAEGTKLRLFIEWRNESSAALSIHAPRQGSILLAGENPASSVVVFVLGMWISSNSTDILGNNLNATWISHLKNSGICTQMNTQEYTKCACVRIYAHTCTYQTSTTCHVFIACAISHGCPHLGLQLSFWFTLPSVLHLTVTHKLQPFCCPHP